MKLIHPAGRVLAIGTAILMHLLLFAAAKPSNGRGAETAPTPPKTDYAASPASGEVDVSTVRMIKSPAVFSLPSKLGFSGELAAHDVQNRKTVTPLPVRSEAFLDIPYAAMVNGEALQPERLMISAADKTPRLPDAVAVAAQARPGAKRVQLAPELARRLMGGVVLPPDLNKPAEQPWMVHASITVSSQGAVEHVLLDKPLDSGSLNQQVLQVLYNLRFKPGPVLESSVEIYSPAVGKESGGAE